MIVWSSSLHPVLFAALALGAAAGAVLLWRRLRERVAAPTALWLFAPKAVALGLVVLALAEPAWRRDKPLEGGARFLVAVDASASMGVRDGAEARFTRAVRLAKRIRSALPAFCRIETAVFDTTLKTVPEKGYLPEPDAGTDLAGCLRTLAERTDPPAAIVLLTDGGDESVDALKLPGAPIFIAGIGAAARNLPDVVIDEAQAPEEAEAGVQFDVTVDLRARGAADASLAGRLAQTPLSLAVETPTGRHKIKEALVNLSRGQARTTFQVKAPEQGPFRLQVSVAVQPGELSALNNERPLTVQIRRRSLHVLFFTRELGADFKLLRQELGRDPGVTLTALYRTLGERFNLQGERLPGDEELEGGFPDNPKTLALYDCIMLGAFPASDWTAAGMNALAIYVEKGGASLFLGGEHAFGAGGYAATPLEPLIPWQIRADEPPLQTGTFPVSIPRESAAHPAVAGLDALLAGAREVSVDSLNRPGPRRPAAEALLQASAGDATVPLLAVQPYGQGRTGALASNTLWKWARRDKPLSDAYGLLLRQWVRWAAGEAEGGRLLAVRWERDRYRPGEEAVAAITLAGRDSEGAILTASVTGPDGRTTPLPVESQAGLRDAYRLRVPFAARGTYTVTLTAARQGVTLETVGKTWAVAPFLPEGARLIPDEAWLAKLAERSGGFYAPEEEADTLIARIRSAAVSRTVVIETPLAQAGPWAALLFFFSLLLEWVLRRRNNLV